MPESSKEFKDALLEVLSKDGLTLANCLTFFAAKRNKQELYFVKEAKERFSLEGELEVDDDAAVSMGDGDGAYVQAWVWVSKEK